MDDMPAGCRGVRQSAAHTCLLGQMTLALYASTMRSDSHRVPEPLRSTSSGDIGMIVEREKMKP
eukprot:scaffold230930_cov33-Tisochrysis_lutea.AAC.6